MGTAARAESPPVSISLREMACESCMKPSHFHSRSTGVPTAPARLARAVHTTGRAVWAISSCRLPGHRRHADRSVPRSDEGYAALVLGRTYRLVKKDTASCRCAKPQATGLKQTAHLNGGERRDGREWRGRETTAATVLYVDLSTKHGNRRYEMCGLSRTSQMQPFRALGQRRSREKGRKRRNTLTPTGLLP